MSYAKPAKALNKQWDNEAAAKNAATCTKPYKVHTAVEAVMQTHMKYMGEVDNSNAPLSYEMLCGLETALDVQLIVIDGTLLTECYGYPQSGKWDHISHYIDTGRSTKTLMVMLKDGEHVHHVKTLSGLLSAECVCTQCMVVYEKKQGHNCNSTPNSKEPHSKPPLGFIRDAEAKTKR